MNKRGHSKTLVPAHPGNRNAVKAGVYSPATLAPLVQARHGEIATRSPRDVVIDRLQREVAGLSILGEAMDQSLEQDGILGRRGEPRTLLSHRLRLDEKLRKALDQYLRITSEAVASLDATRIADDVSTEPLAQTLARWHFRSSLDTLAPRDVDPEYFLEAIITAIDPGVTMEDRLRARKLLTYRKQRRSELCLCFKVYGARDGLEFWDWTEAIREAGVEASEHDPYVASLFRQFTAGTPPEPLAAHRRTREAFHDVVEAEVRRARGELNSEKKRGNKEDRTLAPFWGELLSTDENVTAKQRLRAFSALEDAGALHECDCRRERLYLIEEKVDAFCAYTIRLVVGRHYRAAIHRVRFPETYLAVREAVDMKLRAAAEESKEN